MAKYVSIEPAPAMDAFQYTGSDASFPQWFKDAITKKEILQCPINAWGGGERKPDLVFNLPFGEPNTCREEDWVAQLTYADGSIEFRPYANATFNKRFVAG